MSNIIKLRKGLDIKLQGKAEQGYRVIVPAAHHSLSPLDFEGVTPKMLVKVGDRVKAGTPLFFNKYNERILFTSPVSGTVSAIVRGEKRRILDVIVDRDAQQTCEEFLPVNPAAASREEVIELLLRSGLWPMLVQRPYGIIADPQDKPKAIFVSGFDSAPLAPDYNFILQEEKQNLQRGLEVLGRLTDGKVHLSLKAGQEGWMAQMKGVEIHSFAGKHPAGNVGVQIHHTDPLNKGEKVWTLNVQDAVIFGRLFATGKVDRTRTIAVCGSEIERPAYMKVVDGMPLKAILEGRIKAQKEGDSVRVIAGNVLTGVKKDIGSYLPYNANQITVIPEGDKYEFMGWAMPRLGAFSVSRSYFSWLCPKREYRLDTNLHGGERPFVVTGLYDKYLPMDIYPVYLLKACLAGDIDKMENLGIYEVIEEDIALCEVVDPSKIEMQQILRDGINLMIKEA